MLAPEPLTVETVTAYLDGREKSAQIAAARNRAIAERLQGIPEVYKNLMPSSADPYVLSAAATAIREKVAIDLGIPAAHQTVAIDPIDLEKMSPAELIRAGLAETPPLRDAALLQAQLSADPSEYYGFSKPSDAAASQLDAAQAEVRERAARAARFEYALRHPQIVG